MKFLYSTLFLLISFFSILFAQVPGHPYNPMTAPGAVGIDEHFHILFWANQMGVVYNQVYFSADSSMVAEMDSSVKIFDGYPSTVDTSVNLNPLGMLNYNTKYFWRVVEYDSTGYTAGPIWYFFTHIPSVFWASYDFSYGFQGWTAIGPEGLQNWTWSPTNYAGGIDGELDFRDYPFFLGQSYIVSPSLPQSYSVQGGQIILSFNYMVDWDAGTDTLGCALTTDNGNSWTSIWEINVTGNIGPTTINLYGLQISQGFRVGFYFKGDSYNSNNIYIDDVVFDMPLTPALPPTLLQAEANSNELNVTLNWNPGFTPDPSWGYAIERKIGLPTDTSNYMIIGNTGPSTLTFNDSDVELNSNYTYRVCSIMGPGGGTYSMWGNEATAYVPSVTPVELKSFTANIIDNKVSLKWQTATETNNRGFEIERSQNSNVKSQKWEKISFVNGQGTTTQPHNYSFTDNEILSGSYKYRLKQIDFDGSFKYSNEVEVALTNPTKFSLEQNYPNPFNPTTTIKYSIGSQQLAVLKVYDVLGREVATLVNEIRQPGNYEVEFNASKLSSGIYFYTLRAGDFKQVRKMIIMK